MLVKLLKKPRSIFLNTNKIDYALKSINLICSKVPKTSCLIRASTLKILFNDTKNLNIFIGIRENNSKKFESHAWVTFNNKVILNDEKINSYKTILTI